MRIGAAVVMGVLCASCSNGCGSGGSARRGPASGLPADQILVFAVSQGLWGSSRLTIFRDGRLTYTFTPAGPQGEASEGALRLGEDELAQIAETLDDEEVCSLASERNGIPDEAMPGLLVRMGSLDCRVEAWDGEWRERAPRTTELLSDLTARARHGG